MRTSSAFLILVFLFNLGGFYGVYFGLRQQNKSRMQERMQHPDPPGGKWYSQAELQGAEWVEKQEIRLNGRMLDIREREWRNGQYYYFCIPDHEEERLNEALASASRFSTSNPTDPLPGPVRLWIKKTKDQDRHTRPPLPLPVETTRTTRNHLTPQLPATWCMPVNSPPPEA